MKTSAGRPLECDFLNFRNWVCKSSQLGPKFLARSMKNEKSGQKKGLAASVSGSKLARFGSKSAENGPKRPNLAVFSRFCPKMAKNGEKWPNSGGPENAPGRARPGNAYAKIPLIFDEEPPNSGGGKYSPLN